MNKLFSNFPEITSKQWKQKIQFDLKGQDYNNTLVWNSPEGIAVKPFYHSEDLETPLPNPKTKASSWKACQSIIVNDAITANTNIKTAIQKGAESILLKINKSVDVIPLLDQIDINKTRFYFKSNLLSETFPKQINTFINKNKINNSKPYFLYDIFGNLAATGNWDKNQKHDYTQLKSIINSVPKESKCITINLALYQNSGANMIQQLAYALAHANEYISAFGPEVIPKLMFNVSIGSHYFFEIAKLRALSLLWSTLVSEYKTNITNCHIVAQPSLRNKTLYDYNTNMLRTTTECMSAILGGANSICNLAYDVVYHYPNDFGDRIALNQLLILKHESYFNAVNNPADGSYYIESITLELAQKALNLFKKIEAQGGFLKQLMQGTIQRKIKESANKEQQNINNKKTILVGINKYINETNTMKDDIERFPFLKTETRKTLIEPIVQKRLAEQIEQNRLKTE